MFNKKLLNYNKLKTRKKFYRKIAKHKPNYFRTEIRKIINNLKIIKLIKLYLKIIIKNHKNLKEFLIKIIKTSEYEKFS